MLSSNHLFYLLLLLLVFAPLLDYISESRFELDGYLFAEYEGCCKITFGVDVPCVDVVGDDVSVLRGLMSSWAMISSMASALILKASMASALMQGVMSGR